MLLAELVQITQILAKIFDKLKVPTTLRLGPERRERRLRVQNEILKDRFNQKKQRKVMHEVNR